MVDTTTLGAHDPLPTGPGRNVIVLRRLQEDGPAGVAIQIVLTGKPDEVTQPRNPDGTPMDFETAVAAAKKVAESEGLRRVYVVDRTQGSREQDILQHGGDHSVHMDRLADSDEENGEPGTNMVDAYRPIVGT